MLITGSCGLLGRYLVSHIQQKYPDWEITGIDIERKCNLNYNLLKLDLSTKINWNDVLKGIEPDIVFDLVGVYHEQDKQKIFDINTRQHFDLLNTIQLMELDPVIINIGSSAEYGHVENEENPITESQQIKPLSLYGYTKKWQEEISEFYYNSYNLKIICTRPSNFIGKEMTQKLLPGYLTSMFKQSIKNPTIEISSKKGVRDYIDVRDVVDALIKLTNEPKTIGEVFNISSAKGVSNEKLIQIFEEVSGKDATIIEKNPEEYMNIYLSNKKIKEFTNWSPRYSLKNSVEWCLT